jgi:hypothetical protein
MMSIHMQNAKKKKHKLDVYAKLVTHTTTFLHNLNKFSSFFLTLKKRK